MEALQRSLALNNIPPKKLQEYLASILEACSECSKIEKNGMNGVCAKCNVSIKAINRYAASNILVEHWNLSMEKDWHGDPKLLERYNQLVANIKDTYTKGTAIMFASGHGTGKTMTMSNIIKKAALKGYTALYVSLGDVVSVLTQAGFGDQFVARKELLGVDFLCIDEFDPRWWSNEKSADLYAKMLEGILRVRFGNKSPTFLATNSPNAVGALSGTLKEALGSLFSGYVETFVVMGSDVRK
jgi:DNA replication protein DnaC